MVRGAAIVTRSKRRRVHGAAIVTRRVRTDGFIDPCIPTLAAKPPSGLGWVHEIKHDGYRLIVRRDGKAVRLFTRRGYDWTDRYPGDRQCGRQDTRTVVTLDGKPLSVVRMAWRSSTPCQFISRSFRLRATRLSLAATGCLHI